MQDYSTLQVHRLDCFTKCLANGRPFYFIRPYVPKLTATGIERKKHSIPLGFCDEITMREAKALKQQHMATINAGKFVIQSQIPFREICQRYLDQHVPTLGSAARERYPLQIYNHILPTFADLRLCDVSTPMIEAWLHEKSGPHECKRLKDDEECRQERGLELVDAL